MTSRQRLIVAAVAGAALVALVALVAFAAIACPGPAPGQPCLEAGRNRVVVVALAALSVGLLVTPFAFLAEFAARRRIVYRGAWVRAVRRGVLAAALVAALAGLRLAGAVTVPVAVFGVLLAILADRLLARLEA
ncbi:MAG TPA: hypothetical protein VHK06_04920 [Candidatus Limnocylindria bacterium]|nr:hypothetical protein [Candidatus Limnocylindria bacterium]